MPRGSQKPPRSTIFKPEGGTFSSGNSILMQRERDNKRHKSKKGQVRAVDKIGGTEAGGAGSGEVLAANEKGREGAS